MKWYEWSVNNSVVFLVAVVFKVFFVYVPWWVSEEVRYTYVGVWQEWVGFKHWLALSLPDGSYTAQNSIVHQLFI